MLLLRVVLFSGFLSTLVLPSATSLMRTANAQSNSAQQLAGLWEAKRRLGPDVRGSLSIRQSGGEWRAEIVGRIAVAKLVGDAISFELLMAKAHFKGNLIRAAQK